MNTVPPANEIEYVSQVSICEIFNESQYPEMIANKQLKRKYLWNEHLKHPERKKEPRCTRSQVIRYSDKGQWIVEIHRYLRRDGTIGGSGSLDPKRLRIGNKIIILDTYS